jgi:hypothetical protein
MKLNRFVMILWYVAIVGSSTVVSFVFALLVLHV